MSDRNYTCVADAVQPSKIERPNKRLTQEQFVQKAISVHGDKYDYTETVYVKSKENALFKCREHGFFSQKPNDHLKGRGCPECKKSKLRKNIKNHNFNPLLPYRKKYSTKPLTKYEFLTLSQAKHGDKFDYSLVPLVGIRKKGKVTIICKTCQNKFDQIVSQHVDYGRGCKLCSGIANPLNTEIFIDRAKAIHGDKYDYSLVEYTHQTKKVKIFCKQCQEYFEQSPSCHTHAKQGCKKCGVKSRTKERTKSTKQFISEAIEKHGNKYGYENVVYKTARTKILVTCSKHGVFSILPSEHLYGKGCRSCAKELSVGFSKSRFEKVCRDKNCDAILYLVKMYNDNECFYKVGITSRSIKDRLNRTDIKYKYDIVFEIRENASYIYDLEKSVHRMLKEYHYLPKIAFAGGFKECFSEVPKSVIKILENINLSPQLNLVA